jgi:hypothetical protein
MIVIKQFDVTTTDCSPSQLESNSIQMLDQSILNCFALKSRHAIEKSRTNSIKTLKNCFSNYLKSMQTVTNAICLWSNI